VIGSDDLAQLHGVAEKTSNALLGESEDLDGNGQADSWPWQFGIGGSGGYLDLIYADLSTVSAQVDAGDPIKDFTNYAYDCTQLIQENTDQAARYAATATASAAAGSASSQLQSSVEYLGYALNGKDGDDEGEDIDRITEGTLECAIYYVSEMTRMPVKTP